MKKPREHDNKRALETIQSSQSTQSRSDQSQKWQKLNKRGCSDDLRDDPEREQALQTTHSWWEPRWRDDRENRREAPPDFILSARSGHRRKIHHQRTSGPNENLLRMWAS
ncbi:hypothetical protein M758_3G028300 [Ceratodon purpureus]|nr:hypothetical protein M758_3G028300 [Ceratodon purpureus]